MVAMPLKWSLNRQRGIMDLDFAAPLDDKLTKGFYKNVERYPYHEYLNPSVNLVSPVGSFDRSSGWFKVLKSTKNESVVWQTGELKCIAQPKFAYRKKKE